MPGHRSLLPSASAARPERAGAAGRRAPFWRCGLLVSCLLLSCAQAAGGDEGPAARLATTTPLKHLVIIFQENTSFDSHFGGYPGAPDWNQPEMCDRLAAAIDDPDKEFRYDSPEIAEILVSGDLAVVRLVWTLRVSGRDPPGELVVRENGLDVFQRQPAATWRIRISHAYPEPAPEEPANGR